MGLDFVVTAAGWRFVAMSPVPDLAGLGEPVADALHTALLDPLGVAA